MASLLHSLYIFTAVFGVGVTLLDMVGIVGHLTSESHTPADHDLTADNHSDDANSHHDDGGSHITVLSTLYYLRIFVYFSLGFGPLGWIAEISGHSALSALLWALAGGMVSAVVANAVFKFQRKNLDSSVKVEDLFLGKARVIVPITGGRMGKVRIALGQSVTERYAMAEDAGENLPTDTEVEVVRVTDDCIYVRRTASSLSSENIFSKNREL